MATLLYDHHRFSGGTESFWNDCLAGSDASVVQRRLEQRLVELFVYALDVATVDGWRFFMNMMEDFPEHALSQRVSLQVRISSCLLVLRSEK